MEKAGLQFDYYDPWDFEQMHQQMQDYDVRELRIQARENLDEEYYVRLVERFVDKGEVPQMFTGDPIADYLIHTMLDPTLRALVLTDDVHCRIYQDHMMRFVDTALKRKRFNMNRLQSEAKGVKASLEWSLDKRKDGEQALIDTLGKSYDRYGFRSAFFHQQLQKHPEDDMLWESLYNDYEQAFKERIKQEQREFVEQQEEGQTKRQIQLQTTVPEYLQRHQVEAADFHQAWGMMGGEWNEYDFERYLRLIRAQHQYPDLLRLANRMGRILSPDGEKTMWVGTGHAQHLEHASKSDIHGITMGKQLHSLLPVEMVQMSDETFDELFLLKYATNSLQSFEHKSEQLQPNRHLERKKAKLKGPMIACVDTSGSMVGAPETIARSFMLKLVDLSKRQKRDLFIIAFSVSARPIDAKADRVRLLDFFSHQATGDTKADRMMHIVLELLTKKPEYMSADVVLIGDFRMPLVPQPMLEAIHQHRLQGTCFYGLQIGLNPDNKWTDHFDRIYKVEYQVPRKLGK